MKDKKIRLELTQLEFALLCKEAPEGSTLHKVLERKLDDMVKRELYTDMLKASTEEERKSAKRLYLDKMGVPDSFRW